MNALTIITVFLILFSFQNALSESLGIKKKSQLSFSEAIEDAGKMERNLARKLNKPSKSNEEELGGYDEFFNDKKETKSKVGAVPSNRAIVHEVTFDLNSEESAEEPVIDAKSEKANPTENVVLNVDQELEDEINESESLAQNDEY